MHDPDTGPCPCADTVPCLDPGCGAHRQALFQLAASQPAALVMPTQDITKLYSQYTGAAPACLVRVRSARGIVLMSLSASSVCTRQR